MPTGRRELSVSRYCIINIFFDISPDVKKGNGKKGNYDVPKGEYWAHLLLLSTVLAHYKRD